MFYKPQREDKVSAAKSIALWTSHRRVYSGKLQLWKGFENQRQSVQYHIPACLADVLIWPLSV